MPELSSAHYTFRHGLPAFEQDRDYRLKSASDWRPFHTLESKREGGPRFTCIEIAAIQPDYRCDVSAEDGMAIGLPEGNYTSDNKQILCLAIVAQMEDSSLTANLAAPLVLNIPEALGVQSIQPVGLYSPLTIIRPAAEDQAC